MTHAWLDVMRNAEIARIVRMSYRSKTYTWNDEILVKRSMIRVFLKVQFLTVTTHALKQQDKCKRALMHAHTHVHTHTPT